MATGTLCPTPYQTVLDQNGNPVVGAKITTFVSGTTTPATTYSDVGLTTPNSNPLIADSAGRYVAFLSPGASYKFAITTSADVAIRTVDNISAVPAGAVNLDITGTAGEAITAGNAVYLSDGSGGKTAGSWYKADNTNTYSSLTAAVGIAPASITSGQPGTIRLAGQATGLSALVVGTTYFIGTSGALTSTAPTNRRVVGVADTTSSLVLEPWQLQTPPINTGLCQGRLTLTTGTPVTQADVSAASTIYYTPAVGNQISLYDGTATWTPIAFTETSLALSGLVNAQAYDVFGYNNAGVLALETAEWANATVTITIAAPGVVTWTAHGMSTGWSVTFTTTGTLPTGVVANTQYFITVVDANSFKLSTTLANVAAGTFITTSVSQSGVHTGHQPKTRQTALAYQNGVLVKSGTTTRRYLGSFLTTATTTTEDSLTKRFVWNYYNRTIRELYRVESTASWTYTTNAWQQVNASALNQVDFFVGYTEDMATMKTSVQVSNSSGGISMGTAIGVDSSSLVHARCFEGVSRQVAAQEVTLTSQLEWFPTLGRNSTVWLERSTATGTTTWYGTSGGSLSFLNVSGIFGSFPG